MSRPQHQSDRVFLRPQYAVHYRRARRRSRWTMEGQAGYIILLLLDGKLTCELDESKAEIEAADAVLLNMGQSATAISREAEWLRLTLSPALMLDAALRTRLVGAGSSIIFAESIVRQNERLAQLARSLADELMNDEAGQELVVAALIEQLVIQLLRHHSNMRRSPELELSRAGLVDRRIRRAVELMHARLDENLSLEELAGAAHLSPFHFARLFKKLTGATPRAYLSALRVARAQALLAETDLSVTEISSRVGYDSPSHFGKAFRQSTGLSPRSFRNALVKKTESLTEQE